MGENSLASKKKGYQKIRAEVAQKTCPNKKS